MANSRQWGYDNVGPAFGYMARVDVGEFSAAFLKHALYIVIHASEEAHRTWWADRVPKKVGI